MGFGWLWCVNADSLAVTDVPLLWLVLEVSGGYHVWEQWAYDKALPSSLFCCEPKTALKNSVFLKYIFSVSLQNVHSCILPVMRAENPTGHAFPISDHCFMYVNALHLWVCRKNGEV